MTLLPAARTADLVEQEAGAELLIYNTGTNRMFQLNETSAVVFRACGRLTLAELQKESNLSADIIYLALDELRRSKLIEDHEHRHFKGLSRREAIKRAGLSSMLALPLIASVAAPSAVRAASRSTLNQACATSADCAQPAANCRNVRNGPNTAAQLCCSNPNARITSGFTFPVPYGNCGNCPSTQNGQCCAGGTDQFVNCTFNANGVNCNYACP